MRSLVGLNFEAMPRSSRLDCGPGGRPLRSIDDNRFGNPERQDHIEVQVEGGLGQGDKRVADIVLGTEQSLFFASDSKEDSRPLWPRRLGAPRTGELQIGRAHV